MLDTTLELAPMRGQLATLDAVKEYCLAGNARFTIQSAKTGKRFTYRIAKKRGAIKGDPYFVSVLTGSDNEGDYTFLGSLMVDSPTGEPLEVPHYVWSKKSRIKRDMPSAKAFEWYWGKIESGVLPGDVETWHEGRCGCCGRTLTVPESIKRGIGPECEAKLSALASLDAWL